MTEPTTDAEVIGGCRVEALLGAGSVGRVYRALHLEREQLQALKVIDAQLAAESGFQLRFQQQAALLAGLRHPNITTLFAMGEDRGRYFLTMELLPRSLRTLLQGRRQTFELPVALDVLRQAADALAYAHARGVLHRNLKPENLLLHSNDGSDDPRAGYRLKVSDFGLTQLIDGDEMTAQGLGGSLPYLSPEQCGGQRGSERSDSYALGAMLYELVTGSVPFAFTTLEEAIAADRQGQRPLPPRRLRPELPTQLEQVIVRCLERDPLARPTAAELSRELRLIIAPEQGQEAKAPLTPVIHVASEQGSPVTSVRLTGAGLLVGRAPASGLVLANAAVAEQHVQLDWDGRQVYLSALEPAAVLALDGAQLPSQESLLPWDWRQILAIGPYRLQLQRPATPTTVVLSLEPEAAARQPATTPSPKFAALDMKLRDAASERLQINPGKLAVAQLVLTNLGQEVVHPQLQVVGLPAGTGVVQSEIPQLRQHEQAQVALSIMVPQRSTSLAQPYSIQLKAYQRSDAQKGITRAEAIGELNALWDVTPFAKGRLQVRPGSVKAWRGAVYGITVFNDGNADATYRLQTDNFELQDFQLTPPAVTIEPGESKRAALAGNVPLRWIGQDELIAFAIRAVPEAEQARALEQAAHLRHQALLPRWFLALVPLMLAVVAMFWYWYTHPPMLILQAEPGETLILGDELKLSWDPLQAPTIELRLNGTPLTVPPGAARVVITDTARYSRELELRLELTSSDGIRPLRRAPAVTLDLATPAAGLVFTTPPPGTLVVGDPLAFSWQATSVATTELWLNQTPHTLAPGSMSYTLDSSQLPPGAEVLSILLTGRNQFGSVATQETAVQLVSAIPTATASPTPSATAGPPTATFIPTLTPTIVLPTPAASGNCERGALYRVTLTLPERAGQAVELRGAEMVVGGGLFDAQGRLDARFQLPLDFPEGLQRIGVMGFDKVVLGQVACLIAAPTPTPSITPSPTRRPTLMPILPPRITRLPTGTPDREFNADPTATPQLTPTNTRTP